MLKKENEEPLETIGVLRAYLGGLGLFDLLVSDLVLFLLDCSLGRAKHAINSLEHRKELPQCADRACLAEQVQLLVLFVDEYVLDWQNEPLVVERSRLGHRVDAFSDWPWRRVGLLAGILAAQFGTDSSWEGTR
jgi:hypothetical protein